MFSCRFLTCLTLFVSSLAMAQKSVVIEVDETLAVNTVLMRPVTGAATQLSDALRAQGWTVVVDPKDSDFRVTLSIKYRSNASKLSPKSAFYVSAAVSGSVRLTNADASVVRPVTERWEWDPKLDAPVVSFERSAFALAQARMPRLATKIVEATAQLPPPPVPAKPLAEKHESTRERTPVADTEPQAPVVFIDADEKVFAVNGSTNKESAGYYALAENLKRDGWQITEEAARSNVVIRFSAQYRQHVPPALARWSYFVTATIAGAVINKSTSEVLGAFQDDWRHTRQMPEQIISYEHSLNDLVKAHAPPLAKKLSTILSEHSSREK